MKQQRTLGLLTFAVAAICFFGANAQAEQTYPLKCRSGGNTSMTLSGSNSALRIGFHKSTKAAGPNGATLQPGECAWVDRPISANEPGSISIKTGPNFLVTAVIPSKTNTTFRPYLLASNQAWVFNFSTTDTILTINVRSEGGYLVAPNP